MTVNQISYQQLQETKRANAANEAIAQQNADSATLKAKSEAFKSGYTVFDTIGDTIGGVLTGWNLVNAPAKSSVGKVLSGAITGLIPSVGKLQSGAIGTYLGMDLIEKFSDMVNVTKSYNMPFERADGSLNMIKFKTLYNPETGRWLYKFDNGAVINEIDFQRLYGHTPPPGPVPLGVSLKEMWDDFIEKNKSFPRLPTTIFSQSNTN